MIETVVPDLSRYGSTQIVRGNTVKKDSVRFEVVIHDSVTQNAAYQRVRIDKDGTRLTPLFQR